MILSLMIYGGKYNKFQQKRITDMIRDIEQLVKQTKDNFLKTPKTANGRKLNPVERIKHSAFNAILPIFHLVRSLV